MIVVFLITTNRFFLYANIQRGTQEPVEHMVTRWFLAVWGCPVCSATPTPNDAFSEMRMMAASTL